MNYDNFVFYKLSERYTKNNLARDFLFSTSKLFYLTRNQAKKETEKYLDRIPESLLTAFSSEGWKIIITDENLEDRFNIPYDIYGITDSNDKTIYVYAFSLALQYSLAHELGHFLDYYLGNISKMKDWSAIWLAHRNIPNNRELNEYYFTERENSALEYFANCVLLYINDKHLLQKCNRCACELMDKIFDNLDGIVELFSRSKLY